MSAARLFFRYGFLGFLGVAGWSAGSEPAPSKDTPVGIPEARDSRGPRQVPCGHPPQDADYDGDVDLLDYVLFLPCMSDASPPACACFQADDDADVDLADFAKFQEVFGWNLCQPANPSFEYAGEHGNTFAGWYEFGDVSTNSEMAVHGGEAVATRGLIPSNWDVSGVWQRLNAQPGDSWTVSVWAGHTAAHPLSGATRAICNVEWHGASGLIAYESFTVADSATPVGQMVFSLPREVGPAPAGTESLHLVLGVLQGPEDPQAEVVFDLVEFNPPGFEERQWDDFPGGRILDFSGRSWRVKGPGFHAPGPNHYCDSQDQVWTDPSDGSLHLTIRWDPQETKWCSAEVALVEPLGYGDYIVTAFGPLADAWDANVMLGLFLYEYPGCWEPRNFWWNPADEIDVEIGRWGDPGATEPVQFVVQPDAVQRFGITCARQGLTSHAFRWLPDRVEFRSWCGGPEDEAPENLIHAWTYVGPNVPRPGLARMHLNFWHLGAAPDSGADHDVTIPQFTFMPSRRGG